MRARALPVALAVLLVATGLGAAHGWVVVVDDQVVDDGTVLVREISTLDDSYLAVHLVEDGEPGRVVGSIRVTEVGDQYGLEVPLDEGFWADADGTIDLVAVVHESDGDDEFEWPGDDPILRTSQGSVTDRFAVRAAGNGSARLFAARQQTDGTVTIGRVDLPREGFVVLYADENGERGEVVGVRRLGAGRHENVTVSVVPRFYNDERSRLYLIAGLHVDDGDGTWEPGEDDPVRVGGSPVTTAFDAKKTALSIPTRAPTPTAESTPTPEQTPTPPSTPTPEQTPTSPSTPTPEQTPTPAMPGQPGFGPLAALAALAALASLGVARLAWRRR